MALHSLTSDQKQGNRHPDWKHIYDKIPAEKIPWHLNRLDTDFKEFFQLAETGALLDIGCGLGSQSFALAQMHLIVVGCDISETAINYAQQNFWHTDLEFTVDNFLDTRITKKFDYICDRGLFHVLEGSQLEHFSETVFKLLKPGGHFLLKCFDTRNQDPGFGPSLYNLETLKNIFQPKFNFVEAKKSIFESSTDFIPTALFCVLQKEI